MKRAKPTPTPRLDEVSRAAKARVVLDAAADVLARQGPEGFSLREVAKRVGSSTMVIYTLFGGRDKLLDALCRDGLARLGEALARVEEVGAADPLSALGALALEYRRFALANRPYYHALTVALGPGALVRESTAFQALVATVSRFVEKGLLAPVPPLAIADAMWALVHGMVSLELRDYFASEDVAEARFKMAGMALIAGFRSDPGRPRASSRGLRTRKGARTRP
jgi:AcrR family transcriptional regulator